MPSKKTVADIKKNLLAPATTSHFEVEIPIIDALSGWKGEDGGQAQINLMCSDASLPGSNLATLEVNSDRTGVTEKFAYRRIFDDRIDLTFYVEVGGYSPIKFFEQWMDYITGAATGEQNELRNKQYFYRMKYPNDYIADQGLKITKFEKDYTDNVLEYEFVRSFPLSISSMPVSYDGSSLLKCSVSMSYIRYVVKNLYKKPIPQTNTLRDQSEYNSGYQNDVSAGKVDAGRSLGANDLPRRLRTIA